MMVAAPAPGDVATQSTSPPQQPAPASRRPIQVRREAQVNRLMHGAGGDVTVASIHFNILLYCHPSLVLNELVHECIMGTGPDNKRVHQFI